MRPLYQSCVSGSEFLMAVSHKDNDVSHLCCSLQYCEPVKHGVVETSM